MSAMGNGGLTILQSNDTHGYLEPHPELVWRGGEASYVTLGGYARIAGLPKQVRLETKGAVIASTTATLCMEPILP